MKAKCDWEIRRAKGAGFIFVECGKAAKHTVNGHPRCAGHSSHKWEFVRSYGADVIGGNVVEHKCECGAKQKTNGWTGSRIR